MNVEKGRPFYSFSAVYKVLIWAGFYKLLEKPKGRIKRICHQIYRYIAFLVVVVFNLQHIVFIIQRRYNMNDMFDGCTIEIPQINLLVKFLTLNLQATRIDKIHKLLKDPIFGACNGKDEELLQQNKVSMHRLWHTLTIMCTFSTISWPISHFMRRYTDETAVVPAYVPFETNTWTNYAFSVAIEVIPVLWIGYGHLALDCLVATYYSQAQVQLKILKFNMQHLCDGNERTDRGFQYNDSDPNLKIQFMHYVERFDKVAWYTKEIDSIFNVSMSFQFFTSCVTLCVVVNKLSATPVASVPFMWLLGLILLLLIQVFLYCFFGNLVQYESQSLVNSLYLSNWYTLSPKFRRLLIIAMVRWSRIMTPKVCGVIPLSLNTFISILRSTYSLYAVMKVK